MKGKILLALVAMGLTSSVFASGVLPPPEPMYFDGFYLGAGIGVQHTVSDVHNDITDNIHQAFVRTFDDQVIFADSDDDVLANHLCGDLGNTSLAGEAFVGFGKTFNTVYAGLELFAHYANVNPSLSHELVLTSFDEPVVTANQPLQDSLKSFTSVELSSTWSYGGAFRLGFLPSPKTMIYILLGVEATEFDVDVNHKLIASSSVAGELLPNYAYGYSFDETKWGFMPGVGIETMLTSKLSLRAQYTYASYGEINHDHTFATSKSLSTVELPGVAANQVTVETQTIAAASVADDSIKPHRGLFTLDLTYHFNGV